MKIAITSTGNSLDSEISSLFGRCPYFIITNMENGEINGESPIENPARYERGAGIKAAQYIVNSEVKALISGAPGPNALNILKQVGIKVYKLKSGSVKDNLKLFSEGKLEEMTSSTSEGPGTGGRGSGRRGGMR